jgi:sugar/nucleoside kinase (ribokinase family)
MDSPNIVFIGHVVIDHNKVEQASYIKWGSPAMFMTKYFQSHFGLQPSIIASYGEDFLQFTDGLSLLPNTPNLTHSTIYENIVTNGRRTQYCHYGNAPLPDITPDVQAVLQKADILYLAPLMPTFTADYVTKFMSYVSKDCLRILSPQGYLRHIAADDLVQPREFSEAAAILPYFDTVILSDEDHPQADERAHQWKAASPKTEIIITLNARGADIIQSKGVQHIPTTPIPLDQIVDSTGLGDVFSAAVGYSLYRGKDLVSAVNTAHDATREKLLKA